MGIKLLMMAAQIAKSTIYTVAKANHQFVEVCVEIPSSKLMLVNNVTMAIAQLMMDVSIIVQSIHIGHALMKMDKFLCVYLSVVMGLLLGGNNVMMETAFQKMVAPNAKSPSFSNVKVPHRYVHLNVVMVSSNQK